MKRMPETAMEAAAITVMVMGTAAIMEMEKAKVKATEVITETGKAKGNLCILVFLCDGP